MKGSEPGIIGFYRMEVAKMRFEQGESVDSICRDLEITPDELNRWIDGDDEDDEEEDE
jgi:transposase-like protein